MSSTSGMASRHRRSKADDLARVRDNQRRCRARRREYVAELERKVRDFEASSTQPNTVDLPSAGALMRENEILRKLLKTLGLDEQFLAMYMNAELSASNISLRIQGHEQSSAGPQFPGSEAPQYGTAGSQPYSNLADTLPFNDWLYEANLGLSLEPHLGSPTLSHYSPISNLASPNQGTAALLPLTAPGADTACPQNCLDSTPHLSEFSSLYTAIGASTRESTIPCSTAFAMIVHHNRKGYSKMELDIRLRRGFRMGHTQWDGCRVDSKVLFTVLAEIM
ncbi:hypothetical protein POJ06DRAFT_249522 [Lipomyces tetrasporus]|uniref:BZIP domain-containing protein n=1 Tax=Lipomyces tetrasporus TaxID=54092 RepID=A0AAD7VTR2_9ASCO|nr:uncharacterized protein POJ06DRAFT_249522 [Lipomyces tetrasporus]KAJ8102367.1 hypothetical protein POJ06DRAFT_249522 [Lipomyces tetrasporus]